MERDELLKLKKDELVDMVIELSTSEVGAAIAQRDEALAKVDELAAKLAEQSTDAEKEELSRQVNDLTERLAATVATKGDPRPVVKVNGKQMLIVAGEVRLNDGRKVKAAALAQDRELLEKLAAEGSSILKEVPINA